MSGNLTPRRIVWQGPEGFEVSLDEDGVMLHSRQGGGLEQPDLMKLLELVAEASRVQESGLCPVPAQPTREQARSWGDAYHAHRAKRVVVKAIDAEFNPTDQPF